MPGRPLNQNFERLGYVLLKFGRKYNALCTKCNRVMKNTAASRLEMHRNKCKDGVTKQKEKGRYINITSILAANQEQSKENGNGAAYSDEATVTSMNSIKVEDNPSIDEDIECIDIDKPEFDDRLLNRTHNANNFHSQPLQMNSPMNTDLLAHAFNDDNLSFGLYVSSKLKALNDPYLQATAKHHISRVIYGIEMKQCQLNGLQLPSEHEES